MAERDPWCMWDKIWRYGVIDTLLVPPDSLFTLSTCLCTPRGWSVWFTLMSSFAFQPPVAFVLQGAPGKAQKEGGYSWLFILPLLLRLYLVAFPLRGHGFSYSLPLHSLLLTFSTISSLLPFHLDEVTKVGQMVNIPCDFSKLCPRVQKWSLY